MNIGQLKNVLTTKFSQECDEMEIVLVNGKGQDFLAALDMTPPADLICITEIQKKVELN